MSYKIQTIELKNFGKISNISVNINPGVTYLIGDNGAGKTTTGLNGVWFVLQGLAQKGSNVFHAERFRFIGPNGRSAQGQLVIKDEVEDVEITITRKLTKSSTELKIESSDGRKLDQEFLDEIFNIFTMNISAFPKMSPKEQALALGLDTSKLDARLRELYTERTDANREVKRLSALVEEAVQTEEIRPVNIKELIAAKARIDKENHDRKTAALKRDSKKREKAVLFNQELKQLIADREHMENQLKEAKEKVESLKRELRELPEPRDPMPTDFEPEEIALQDTSEIEEQIETAQSTNEKSLLYQEYTRNKKALDAANEKAIEISGKYTKIQADRIALIQNKKLPFSNMTIDENGGLLINDKPFSEPYFSKGEIMRMSASLAAHQSGEKDLKYIYIPEASSLDRKNREVLFTMLAEKGFQVLAEFCEHDDTENAIIIEEGKVVDNNDNEQNEL